MKTDLFHSCCHCWVFQIYWHIECSTCTASSFRIWNSSTGILSPPLALFIVMLSKAHLTSHSRVCGSRWVITPLCLSGSWRSFLYGSSVYSCHLFLISSAWLMLTQNHIWKGILGNQVPSLTKLTVEQSSIKSFPSYAINNSYLHTQWENFDFPLFFLSNCVVFSPFLII